MRRGGAWEGAGSRLRGSPPACGSLASVLAASSAHLPGDSAMTGRADIPYLTDKISLFSSFRPFFPPVALSSVSIPSLFLFPLFSHFPKVPIRTPFSCFYVSFSPVTAAVLLLVSM